MRVLVTGGHGQLGSALLPWLAARGDEVLATDAADLDITDPQAVSSLIRSFHPDVVVNAAAWTAVDLAEEREADALRVNADGPANLALACAGSGARLLHISTDYVFAGDATSPYRVEDPPAPRSAYGRTKFAGEEAVRRELPEAHWIVRTAWLYGLQGENFAKTMMRLADTRDSIQVVDDQRGQPTYAGDLAAQLVRLLDAQPPAGTFHATNAGECTWFTFAQAVLEASGRDAAKVVPCTSAEFVRPAPRPAYSVLDDSRWAECGIAPMRPWREALEAAIAEGLRP